MNLYEILTAFWNWKKKKINEPDCKKVSKNLQKNGKKFYMNVL